MKIVTQKYFPLFLITALLTAPLLVANSAVKTKTQDLDSKVKKFLDSQRWGRGDMNVPSVDGQTLHDIIVKNNYTRALEIGTSTGHSGIWIAWALSKTGGSSGYLDYLYSLLNYETTIDSRGGGLAISYKKSK